MDGPVDYQRFIDAADDQIVNHPRRTVVAFLLLTVVFAGGLANVSTDAGTQGFTQDVPAQQALERVQDDFGPSFASDTGSTQLIQSEQNVLSKPSMLRMLTVQQRLQETEGLRVESTSSAASVVARSIDPSADTLDEQIDAIEGATPGEIDRAVRAADSRGDGISGLLSQDFNPTAASASATIGVVTHEIPSGLSSSAGQGGSSPLTSIQLRAQFVVDSVDGDIRVFGDGIISAEFGNVIFDSLIVVVPAAVVFIVLFLLVAYRDLADLLLGLVSLLMAIVWTFGFMGLAGIPFNQILIAVPPLLLAVGIDFGIHAVNRYREERVGGGGIGPSMTTATDQLLVAFFIVMGTTVIGFAANLTSALPPIRDFGIVAAVGIVFTFHVFGIFLPASKVWLDRSREHYPIPTFSTTPLGEEGSALGRVLSGGVGIARFAPAAFVVLILLVAGGAGLYATGIDTSFSNEDFLPPEETPAYLSNLPEPFKPSEYTVTRDINFLEEKFSVSQSSSVTIYVQGPLRRNSALESIHRAGDDPPDSFVRSDGRAETTSIVTVIQDRAARDPEFRRLVDRNDRNDNGIPDRNLERIYDYLLASDSRGQALQYITEDYRATQVVYSVEADASQSEVTADARTIAEDFRFAATATGATIVFQAISDLILESAVVSLAVALGGTVLFLLLIYWVLEGRPSLGLANTIPIVITVAMVAGSMRAAGIAFNAFTATILAITIGLGIDYSVHITQRFADEYERNRGDLFAALERTVRGTGGALAGSMLTTVFGLGVLVLAVFPAIGQFGLLAGLSVFYAFLASLFVLPAALVVWARLFDRGGGGTAATGEPDPPSDVGTTGPVDGEAPT
ncbi:MAG: MMPL family transporter [Haloarculaceae archaeon]